jgi:hypothetical protein
MVMLRWRQTWRLFLIALLVVFVLKPGRTPKTHAKLLHYKVNQALAFLHTTLRPPALYPVQVA